MGEKEYMHHNKTVSIVLFLLICNQVAWKEEGLGRKEGRKEGQLPDVFMPRVNSSAFLISATF